ncbi:MAG: HAMP domain-containing histidine kinase [Clostridia bacterium]|nr:HAMP domain-containing histidine kinase [Clostridia bacterium]
MDTKLKKFNFSMVKKIIALLLCIISVVGISTQLVSTADKVQDTQVDFDVYADAFTYSGKKEDIWKTSTFRQAFSSYVATMSVMVSEYKDGSKEAYEAKKNTINGEAEQAYQLYKTNLINLLQRNDSFYYYLCALYNGDIIETGKIAEYDGVGSSADWNELEFSDNWYYDEVCLGDPDFEYYGGKTELYSELEKKMKEVGADGVCLAAEEINIFPEGGGGAVRTYSDGYYGFRINDEQLRSNLIQGDYLDPLYTEAYTEFKKDYEELRATLNENYASGSYFVKDAEGNTYTNVSSLNKKSTNEEIAEYFSSLGFYCYQSDGVLTTKDGMAYSDAFDSGIEPTYYYTTTLNLNDAVTSPPAAVPTAESETGIPATTVIIDTNDEETTRHIYAEDSFSSPFINGKQSDIICFVGVDLYGTSDTCNFATMHSKIENARIVAKDVIITCGILLLQFLACFIYLLTKAGRRDGDEKIYLFTTDKMFTDWRIALDIAFGCLSLWGLILYIDHADVYYDLPDSAMTIVPLLITVTALCIIDLFLFTARHIRNKSLFKSFFLVWIIRKVCSIFGKMTVFGVKDKLLNVLLIFLIPVTALGLFFIAKEDEYMLLFLPVLAVYYLLTVNLLLRAKSGKSPVTHFKEYLNTKLQYIRGFEKEVIIKGLIILAVNGPGIFFGIVEIVNNDTCFILLLLALFDLFVAIQLVRFIAGVKKIFSAVDEIKSGNYDVQINLFSLPSSLREPATKLMSLRDGLKKAVEEAVKQEQTKTELITNVSHDLKTPLTSVINYVELLKKCSINDEDAREYLDILGEKSDRLKKLIEDLVEASKASTGNLKTEIVDVSLNEITSQIIGEYSDLFEQKGLSLITSFPQENIIVRADSKMLYRVLENLMGNVVKYAMENTRVYLNVERRTDKGILSIKNISGSPLNISAEQLKARFVRGDEARTTEGSGLGLSIAESLCELQGGKLNIMINGDLFVAEVEMRI